MNRSILLVYITLQSYRNSWYLVKDGYMLFPYPFFVNIPGNSVTAKGLSEEERIRNLEMLKSVNSETAMEQNINPIWTNRVAYVDWVKTTK